ncbi:hypothetical protein [Slackia isoflavoniconvertens]|uniref:hypothetical protein n=1 Tax=Slackia isoflavoniconvertens TaxID=572010 RepID=UPI003F95046D
MDRVEFHRLAVLFSGGLIEREMRAAFPRRHFARKRRRSLSREKKKGRTPTHSRRRSRLETSIYFARFA